MEAVSEESEIKIEYIESIQPDPLSENLEENLITEIRAVTPQPLVSEINNSEYDEYPTIETKNNQEDEYLDDNSVVEEAQQRTSWFRAVDASGRFLCRFCDLTYSTVQTLRHHIKTKHSVQAKNLKNFILANKRNKKIKCHICQTKFTTITGLQEHVQQSHDLEKIKKSCFYCDAMFANALEVTNHLYLKHEKQINRFFICTVCGYRTLKKSHYNQHKNTHLNLKNYDCQDCNYKTSYLPNLTIHLRIHTDDKPYRCEYKNCSYRCAAKSALSSHKLKHVPEENMLFCDKCSYKTVYKQSLKKHIDSHRRNCIAIKL